MSVVIVGLLRFALLYSVFGHFRGQVKCYCSQRTGPIPTLKVDLWEENWVFATDHVLNNGKSLWWERST